MPPRPTRGLAAAAALSCALPAAAAAPPLKWAPPPLDHPLTIEVRPGAFTYWCKHGEDVRLVWPQTEHVGQVTVAGCHNVVSIGGWNTLPKTVDLTNSAPSRGFYAKDDTGTVFVEGLLIDGAGGGMADGVDIAAPKATVVLQNVRIEGIYGFSDQFHADCLQPFGGVARLLVYRMSCRTAYQGLTTKTDLAPIGEEDLEDIDVVAEGPVITGRHNDGGYLYWPCQGPECRSPRVSLRDVWLQPRPGQAAVWSYRHDAVNALAAPAMVSFPGLPIDGHVNIGRPPEGEFVPAGVAGAHYQTPGYAAPGGGGTP